MAKPELIADAGRQQRPASGDQALLTRLNRRGFRLIMVADALVLITIAVGTMLVRFGLDWPTYPMPAYLVSFTVVIAVFLASLYFGGLYEREPRLGAPPVLPRALRQTLAAGGLVALLRLAVMGIGREVELTTIQALPFPISHLVVLIVLGALGVAGNRQLMYTLRTRREGPPRVALAGEPDALPTARGHLEVDPDRARIVCEVEKPSQLLSSIEDAGATDVVLLSGSWIDELYPRAIQELDKANRSVLVRVSARETLYGLERIREVGGLPFVLLRAQTIPRSRAHFKRLVDLTLLVVASPLVLALTGLVALYQLVVAGRPLLYWQDRVGEGGRIFRMVKFRTMRPDAEADGRGARLAELDDPRVIPACQWIRAMRFDELPQLWNVLRGEMSLVGPRPERPELTAEFERSIPGYDRRHEVPPGLTGLAQIHGRYHTAPEYKLGYDLQYLVNWSPVLDLEILLRTLWVVLTRRL